VARTSDKVCINCRRLYEEFEGIGDCYVEGKSSGKRVRACRNFKEGTPFVPTFKGKKAKVLKLKEGEPSAFVFHNGSHFLALTYDVDRNGYGYYKIKLLGLDEDLGLHLTKFTADEDNEDFAFFGEVAVTGARGSDLYRSFNFEDEDERDTEGNLVNKPKEVLVLPRRRT
jgi:hypothetical protein